MAHGEFLGFRAFSQFEFGHARLLGATEQWLRTIGLPEVDYSGLQFFRPLRQAGTDQRLWAFCLAHGQWMLCIEPEHGKVVSLITDGLQFHKEHELGETFVNSSVEQFCEFLVRWGAASLRDQAGIGEDEQRVMFSTELAEMRALDPDAFRDDQCFWPLHTEEARYALGLE